MLFQGSIKDLESISQPQVQIEVANTVDAANFLKKQGITVNDITDDVLCIPFISKTQMGEINNLLNTNGYVVYSIHKVHKDLEKLFLDITQKSLEQHERIYTYRLGLSFTKHVKPWVFGARFYCRCSFACCLFLRLFK